MIPHTSHNPNQSRPRQPRRASMPTEHAEQAALIQWRDLMMRMGKSELGLLFAIPNGAKLPYVRRQNGKRYSPQAVHLLAEGLTPGVPDLFLAVARGTHHGLFIEMKRADGKLCEAQTGMHAALGWQGYAVVVCRSFEGARDAILRYLDLQ